MTQTKGSPQVANLKQGGIGQASSSLSFRHGRNTLLGGRSVDFTAGLGVGWGSIGDKGK